MMNHKVDGRAFFFGNDDRLTADIYPTGKKFLPWYSVYSGGKTSTIDEKVDYAISGAWDTYENRMAAEPEKISLTLPGRTAKGISYRYSTEDGTDTNCVVQYFDDVGDQYLIWTAVYKKDDTTTVPAMEAAMRSVVMKTN